MIMTTAKGNKVWDVIIIGSGLYGIQAARYYLDIHPTATLAVLESDEVIGERVYNAFWTQTTLGMAEFSDRPLEPPPTEEQYYGFFPAIHVTNYLESYVDSHIYNGLSVRDRIRFSTEVQGVTKCLNQWHLTLGTGEVLKTPKLIDATGMTSRPSIPTIPGHEQFLGLQLHHKEFGQYEDRILTDPGIRKVVILGGAKSAADVAYACAKAGKEVSWIIREDGAGPAAFLSAKGRGWYKNSGDTFYTRFVAALHPSPFNEETWLYRFLQRTTLGLWLVRRFWDRADRENRRAADYCRVEGRTKGFANLEPETPLFWQNDSSGINQRADFFSTIAKNVHVYRRSIHHFTTSSIVLDSSENANWNDGGTAAISLDAVIYCTGWDPISPIFPNDVAAELGLSVPAAGSCKKGRTSDQPTRQTTTSRFPLLDHRPKIPPMQPLHTPFQLYRSMAPLADFSSPSIVFLGKLVVGNNFRVAEAQALWAVAYFDGLITPSTLDDPQEPNQEIEDFKTKAAQDVADTVRWCSQRYLNKGLRGNWYFFDAISYSDMLLAQLNITSHRRKTWIGWWRDLFDPCHARDLKDIADEYETMHSIGESPGTQKPRK